MSPSPRSEWKYLVDRAVMGRLLARWSPFLRADEHAASRQAYPVLSQYFDSPDLGSRTEKVEGEGRRVKFRLRAYGFDFDGASRVYLEVKQRILDGMRKVREPVEIASLKGVPYLRDDGADLKSVELRSMIARRAPLVPTAQTFYMREAFRALVDPTIRVTFDSWLMFLRPGERIDHRTPMRLGRRLLGDDTFVLEVKMDLGTQIPSWLDAGLRAEGLGRRTFSKYVKSVDQLLRIGWRPEEPISAREG